MGQAQINVKTRACSWTFIARTKQVALTHNVRGKELSSNVNNTRGKYNVENILFEIIFCVNKIFCSTILDVMNCLWGWERELLISNSAMGSVGTSHANNTGTQAHGIQQLRE